ncbi:Putative NADPH-quinone reductase (modulator of drug activity B) [Alkalispirochaeta americana]|uniref:Putative NADPH-quinone reductase (Modulator of drug activity B) n=1 Tax=Alkalispirochaeta americana TaxID=159291 RepID=A0A1N6NFA1_9SPIO|nr:NAD(P)H-dependent oxidoreductase [Alkalispirochaeta americana]SIP90759.1 Putative NADPH-quinone reductase (modulator of drug activity B) [Alkalispirochaeta americana]
MIYLVVYSHPRSDSFTHALVERIAATLGDEGHGVHCHDLYAEHFQPVLENEEIRRRFSFDDLVTQHTRELREAAGLILVYPDWWGMPPAILKGWIDRILRPGVAFDYRGPEFLHKHLVPLLTDKKGLVISTTDETNPLSQDAMNTIWRERVFEYVGIRSVSFKTFYGVRESTLRDRREWLLEAEELVLRWL